MDSAPRFPPGRHRPFNMLKTAGVTAVRRLALGAVGAMVLATFVDGAKTCELMDIKMAVQ
jgi:hypothetical protein